MRQVNSFSHTRRECKYHIAFIPKYRFSAMIFGQIRKDLGKLFHQLAHHKQSLTEQGNLLTYGLCAYDDIDSTEILGIPGNRLY